MIKDLHRGARRQELAEREDGFAEGVRAAAALLRQLRYLDAAEVLESAYVVDAPAAPLPVAKP